MINILEYVKRNGDYTFYEKKFTEIDALIMSTIVYVDFTKVVKKSEISLGDALELFLNKCDIKKFMKCGFFQRDIIKLVKIVKDKIRYRGIMLSDYVYEVNQNKQFGAITMKLPTKEKLIVFEGTDHNMSGWKEDFAMIYKFPVPADTDAIKYLNEHISFWDRNVYVIGHSKGGHLSMTAASFCKWYKKFAIKKVYNFDGPGFRYDEFYSKQFIKMSKRIEYIVPNYSLFGILLRHPDNLRVIKTNRKGIMAHSMFNWLIKDDSFILETLSRGSRNLSRSILMWLEQHDDIERKKMVTDVFKYFKKYEIVSVVDFTNIKKLVSLIKNLDDLDDDTKDFLKQFIEYNYQYHIANKKDDIIIE